MQTMYCNLTFRRIRAIIDEAEKEYILFILNVSF